ncbi:MAG: hypothetical protein ACD_16C00030G0004 [uncultured bacterium]|nr:MAG: hypothetical protein ACD_16C00030G0004 [uncultured bacterium]OFW81731.1 MAG: hypothetical protein A3E50_07070 [Alphaproteobacteria bacterium RIFCSPHIGHO2_12_FULL_42_100]OFW85482.1 MAG: hypothetical protein A2W06_04770 [Alphaproteobacteria bacterium RBG_16_42_14]OFW90723.1 MAG: hypothetical protein A3C41_05460 [Alphaproteobacteria bacterium RIFCSPHIGHO2_02_FULL_42_30]OFW92720.1 MAG: hypothetical protein A2W46_01220 [Alphaproteobacteria bacterium RIFCSPHIGHO2_12_42_13]OFX04435.1 MAG: hyp
MTHVCFKCRGNLQSDFQKHGLHKNCFKEWFHLADEGEDFWNLILRQELSAHDKERSFKNTSFFHGKFKKYSAELGGKTYILKMSPEYPELAKTEYLCNQIGIAIGIDIPKNYLLTFQGQENCFVSYNFMQDFAGSNLEHIWHFLKPTESYNLETLVKIIEKQTQRLSEIQKFIKVCLFDALIGNHDRHGRNLGFISTSQGYIFSPCYDNPSYFGIADFLAAAHAPRCAIATSSTEEPMMKEYIMEYRRLGFEDEIHEFKKCLDIEKLTSLINHSFLSEERKKAFLTFVERQYREVNYALSD